MAKLSLEANPKEVMRLLAKAWQNVDRGVLFECQKLSEEDKQKKASECVDEPEKKTSEHTDEPEKKEKKGCERTSYFRVLCLFEKRNMQN